MMVELDGVAYHVVPDLTLDCEAHNQRCAFNDIRSSFQGCGDRLKQCAVAHDAPANIIFLTQKNYVKYITARLTS